MSNGYDEIDRFLRELNLLIGSGQKSADELFIDNCKTVGIATELLKENRILLEACRTMVNIKDLWFIGSHLSVDQFLGHFDQALAVSKAYTKLEETIAKVGEKYE